MNMQNLSYFFLFVFGVGAGCSQSLLSLGAAALALLGLIGVVKNFSKIKSNPFHISAITLIFAWIGLLLLKSLDLSHPLALNAWREVPLFLLLLLPLGNFCFEPQKLKKITGASLIALHIGTAYSIYQIASGAATATGFFRSPIYYAYSLFPAFLFCSEYFFRFKKGEQRGFNLLVLSGAASALLGILLSNNRMTFLLAFLYLIVRGIYFFRRPANKKILSLGLLFFLGALFFVSQRPLLIKKFDLLLKGKDRSTEGRLILWKENFKIIQEHPLTGIGYERNAINTATPEMSRYAHRWDPGHDIYAHNIFIQTIAESGVLGFLFFYGFWISLALCFPNLQFFLIFIAASGISENIFNNSRACLPLLFYTLLGSLFLKSKPDNK